MLPIQNSYNNFYFLHYVNINEMHVLCSPSTKKQDNASQPKHPNLEAPRTSPYYSIL